MKIKSKLKLSGLLGSAAGLVLATASAQNAVNQSSAKETVPVVTSTSSKPAWLTEVSLGLKEGYDSNLLMGGSYLPYSPDPAKQALEPKGSWVTTIAPKIGVDLVPLLGDQKFFKTVSIGYAGDYSLYANDSSETNYAHRFSTAIKGGGGDLKFSLENVFAYIDGSKMAPIYPGGYRSAYATAIPRERRNQEQDRSKIFVIYTHGNFFIRPIASLLYYNLNTYRLNPNAPNAAPSGYQNYANRSDVNGGFDLGYHVMPKLAATLGYRYGSQYQQQFSWVGTGASAANDARHVPYSPPALTTGCSSAPKVSLPNGFRSNSSWDLISEITRPIHPPTSPR